VVRAWQVVEVAKRDFLLQRPSGDGTPTKRTEDEVKGCLLGCRVILLTLYGLVVLPLREVLEHKAGIVKELDDFRVFRI
jgi:hypothetical protein